MNDNEHSQGRRDALRKIAAGGAAVWAAPAVMSASASAQTGSPPPSSSTTSSSTTTTSSSTTIPPTTVPEVCIGNGDWVCGDTPVFCGTQGLDGACVCEVDTEGNDICWANVLCSHPLVVACVDNSDCAPGWKCASSCCETACLPPCDGTILNGRIQAGALTALGS